MAKNIWSREETIVAFNVYCKIPFKDSSKTHPMVIKYAKIIGRSPSALNMKVGNLGRLDPELRKRGIVGLSNGSKTEEMVWREFHGNWDDLAFESEKIIANFQNKPLANHFYEEILPVGSDKLRLVKTRINQSFFRSSILSAYNSTCCITGLIIPELLIASHIIPWRSNISRTNPRNGLCLNSLHDKAFDRGLLSINDHYQVKISKFLKDKSKENATDFFNKFDNQKITMPDKFRPERVYLEEHFSHFLKNEYN
ncbi:MAG: HNH endonuclease [Leeuwenhoekiella sp.]